MIVKKNFSPFKIWQYIKITRSRTELHLNVRTQFRSILTGASTMFY